MMRLQAEGLQDIEPMMFCTSWCYVCEPLKTRWTVINNNKGVEWGRCDGSSLEDEFPCSVMIMTRPMIWWFLKPHPLQTSLNSRYFPRTSQKISPSSYIAVYLSLLPDYAANMSRVDLCQVDMQFAGPR